MIERAMDGRHAGNRREKIKLSEPGFREQITLVTQSVGITHYSERKDARWTSSMTFSRGFGPATTTS